MVAMEPWTVDELAARGAPGGAVRRRCPTPRCTPCWTCWPGRYPSEEFGELRPRITWDRVTDELRGRPGAQRLAVTSGGTIPDRGLFAVMTPARADGRGSRVGELDEEMVYESRVGDTFLLGTSIVAGRGHHPRPGDRHARRPGVPARMPFWKGDATGPAAGAGPGGGRVRPRDVRRWTTRPRGPGPPRPGSTSGRPTTCSRTCASSARPPGTCPTTGRSWSSGSATSWATGGSWCTPRSARRSTRRGRWRSPRGMRERRGVEVQASRADDGIVLRLPDAVDDAGAEVVPTRRGRAARPGRGRADRGRRGGRLGAVRVPVPGVRGALAAAAPARPEAAHAAVAAAADARRSCCRWPAKYEQFPVVLEAMRECLQDVYDLPGLRELMARRRARRVRVVEVETRSPSPFARSLLFGYVGHVPLRGRRPAGRAPGRGAGAGLDAAGRAARARRRSGSCSTRRCWPRSSGRCSGWPRTGTPATPRAPPTCCGSSGDLSDRRGRGPRGRAGVAGRAGGRAPGDPGADRRRGALDRRSRTPAGCATRSARRCRSACRRRSPSRSPIRWATCCCATPARTGRSAAAEAAARFGLGVAVVAGVLDRLVGTGRLVRGELRPLAGPGGAGQGTEYCDAEVLRRLRRASLARLRAEVEPVEPRGAGPVPAGVARRAGRPGGRRGRMRRTADDVLGGGRAAGRGADPGQRAGVAGAAGPAARATPPRCSTS